MNLYSLLVGEEAIDVLQNVTRFHRHFLEALNIARKISHMKI